MAKKSKSKGPSIDWYEVGMSLSKIVMGLVLIYLGIVTFTDPGERTYNKYLHAIRKMFAPQTKPSDIVFPGYTFDGFNKDLTKLIGAFYTLSGVLVLVNRNFSNDKLI